MNVHSEQVLSNSALKGLFDYAGLFPPAGLSMQETVSKYTQHQQSVYSWMLGAIVIPASRLAEFAEAAGELADATSSMAISVLSADWSQDRLLVEQFQQEHGSKWAIKSIETRELEAAKDIAAEFGSVYVELPASSDVESQVVEVKQAGANAKVRTGGLTADAFPSSEQVAMFLMACSEHDVAFKATAGLHHPLAKMRPTCDQADAPIAPMHGFANLFAAVAKAEQGAAIEDVAKMLVLPEDEAKVHFGTPNSWEESSVVRSRFHSIGSCSFDEPVEDLLGLGWL